MPPKIKITKNEIINTALSLVRECGTEALNARNIAASLGCSTQPIFSNYQSMDELRTDVNHAAYEKYLEYLKRESESGKYPVYKAYGIAYIRFASEEKELFKLLFMSDRSGTAASTSPDFTASVKIIMQSNGLSEEKATLLHLENWSFVHGIATMLATSFLDLSWELISDMLSDVYQGLRLRHISEENK